jgi:hypothetical protein
MKTMKLLSALLLLFCSKSMALSSESRFFFLAGVGQSTTISADNKATVVEAPIGINFEIDQFWRDGMYIYGEHMRSAGTGGSSVGLTGFGWKYYPWLSPQHLKFDPYSPVPPMIVTRGSAYFIGTSIGIGQASVPAVGNYSAAVAVSPYFGLKAGFEYPLTDLMGFCLETNVTKGLAGSGSVDYFNGTIGFYFEL